MSPFIRASAIALQDQPTINAGVYFTNIYFYLLIKSLVIDGPEIIYRNYCDISIAVATPKGLVVPVVRNVETMSYAKIEKTLAELGAKVYFLYHKINNKLSIFVAKKR